MRRVAEIIYIVPEEREAFLNGAINPDDETANALWLCGVRKQQYFALNDYLFMTFEYNGSDFNSDMTKMAAYLDSKGLLVKQRRKDVPPAERSTTNWWAPVKRLGSILDTAPHKDDELLYNLMDCLDGAMSSNSSYGNTAYDEDDWSDSFHF